MFIYLHVPFCQSHCHYCDFYVVLSKYGGQSAYIKAVQREIRERFSAYSPSGLSPIQSLYVGGGTPSLLSAADYQAILETLAEFTPIALDAELTLEANPNALVSSFEDYRAVGFNRLSIGVQSLNDTELQKLSRIHTAKEAKQAIQTAKQAGFDNISIDLMYGIPGQTANSWQKTLEETLALEIQHVSMYGLKVEPGTGLDTLLNHPVASLMYALPDEDTTVAMYQQALDILGSSGFERYEFSNLAKQTELPGQYRSRHNLNYWHNGLYVAFGVAAHGYVANPNHQEQLLRYETIRDLAQYLENPLTAKTVICPLEEQLENALIFGLRKQEGVHIPTLEKRYGINFSARYGWILEKYVPLGLLLYQDVWLRFSDTAIPLSNEILAEFLSDT